MDALPELCLDKIVSLLDYPAATMFRFTSKRYARAIHVRRGLTWMGACDEGARYGNTAFIAWARAHRSIWSSRTCALAASYGHLGTLQWLHANACAWDASHIFVIAATRGDLSMVQWLYDRDCPWNEFACYAAARHGHLPLLKWLTAQGCPWDAHYCLKTANRHNRAHVVAWIETCVAAR